MDASERSRGVFVCYYNLSFYIAMLYNANPDIVS
jgi:hypothetical protein